MFCPNGISGTLMANATSQAVDISTADPETGALRLLGSTGIVPFVKFGDSTVVATPNDMRVSPNAENFKIPVGATHFAIVTASGSLAVSYTVGQDA